jgi:hypothetical protein
MISNVLFQSVQDIRELLEEHPQYYLRTEIEGLLEEMERVEQKLDAQPMQGESA